MRNKKLIIILVVVAIIIAAFVYFLLKPQAEEKESLIPESQQTSEEKELVKTTDQAINKLQNFTDSTSEQYLNDLKPYMSEEMFQNEQELSKVQKDFNDKQGFASSQKYTVSKIELVETSDEDGQILTYKVTGIREYKDSKEDDVTYVKYEKLGDQWKIIDIIPAD